MLVNKPECCAILSANVLNTDREVASSQAFKLSSSQALKLSQALVNWRPKANSQKIGVLSLGYTRTKKKAETTRSYVNSLSTDAQFPISENRCANLPPSGVRGFVFRQQIVDLYFKFAHYSTVQKSVQSLKRLGESECDGIRLQYLARTNRQFPEIYASPYSTFYYNEKETHPTSLVMSLQNPS
jgi:hypothetical protein